MASKSSATLRDLRMSTAMSSMTLNRTRSILAPSSSSTSVSRKRVRKDNKIQEQQEKKENSQNSRFSTAPQKTLNLVTPNTTKRDWLKKADEIIKAKPKETKKVRKKRLWLQAKEKGGLKAKNGSKQRYVGDWAFLPDIVLEIIFQYLPFEQKTNCAGVCPNWARIMAFSSVRFFFQNFEWSRRGSIEA